MRALRSWETGGRPPFGHGAQDLGPARARRLLDARSTRDVPASRRTLRAIASDDGPVRTWDSAHAHGDDRELRGVDPAHQRHQLAAVDRDTSGGRAAVRD